MQNIKFRMKVVRRKVKYIGIKIEETTSKKIYEFYQYDEATERYGVMECKNPENKNIARWSERQIDDFIKSKKWKIVT